MPYKSSGLGLPKTDEFKRPYENTRSESLRHAKIIAKLDSRPGSKSTRYKSNKMYANHLNKLKTIGTITHSKPLPRKTLKTSGGIKPPRLVRSTTLKPPTLKRTSSSLLRVSGKKSRKRNTKKRKLTKKKNRKRQQS